MEVKKLRQISLVVVGFSSLLLFGASAMFLPKPPLGVIEGTPEYLIYLEALTSMKPTLDSLKWVALSCGIIVIGLAFWEMWSYATCDFEGWNEDRPRR